MSRVLIYSNNTLIRWLTILLAFYSILISRWKVVTKRGTMVYIIYVQKKNYSYFFYSNVYVKFARCLNTQLQLHTSFNLFS